MTGSTLAAALTMLTVVAAMLWLDLRCLADLAGTDDRQLRYFNRLAWALIIVLSFPVGPVLYLMYAKEPRR